MAQLGPTDSQFVPRVGNYLLANWVLSITIQVTATLLIALRIWRNFYWGAKRAGRVGSTHMSILWMVVESGAVYSITAILTLVFWCERASAGAIVGACLGQVSVSSPPLLRFASPTRVLKYTLFFFLHAALVAPVHRAAVDHRACGAVAGGGGAEQVVVVVRPLVRDARADAAPAAERGRAVPRDAGQRGCEHRDGDVHGPRGEPRKSPCRFARRSLTWCLYEAVRVQLGERQEGEGQEL